MPSVYQLISDGDIPIDAHLELDGNDIVFHSRGGKRGAPNQRNSDYGSGLRLLLQRLAVAKISVDRAWVDSDRVQNVPIEHREILGEADRNLSPEQCFTLLSSKMKSVGQSGDGRQQGGNSTKRIRVKLAGNPTQGQLIEALKLKLAYKDTRALKRLPADQLHKVTPEHVWNAIEKLLGGNEKHGFGESTDYDLLIDDGVRLPPKAVFGVAASEALGFELLPENFSAGLKSPCFRILAECGYEIVLKAPGTALETIIPPDREWVEGVICQDSCHVVQAASFTNLSSCRTGLSQTVAGRSQLRVEPRQRSGLAALAAS